MRKFLMAVAIGGLVLLVAAPAMALDFKFGGEYRIRFFDYNNTGFDSSNFLGQEVANNGVGSNTGRGNVGGVQIRVRPRFDVSDDNGNIQATIRFEYGDTTWGAGGGANGNSFGNNGNGVFNPPSGNRTGNGAGGSIGADGVALETKWAYVDFAMPMNFPMRIRAGVQPWYLPKGLVIDDDAAGVRGYGSYGIVSYDLAWYRIATAPASANATAGLIGQPRFDATKDDNFDFYQAKVDFKIAPWLNAGAYYLFGNNRANCAAANNTTVAVSGNYFGGKCEDPVTGQAANRSRQQNWFGLTFTGKVSTVDYDLDFVYGAAKGGSNGTFTSGAVNGTNGFGADPTKAAQNVQGFALDGGVHIPIGPVKLNLLGSYASGDSRKGDNHSSSAYPVGPGPSWSGAGGQYELIGEGGAFDVVEFTQHTPTNLWMLGFTVEYVPVKALWLKMAYGFAGFSEKWGNCATALTPTAAGGFVQTGSQCYGPIYYGKVNRNDLTDRSDSVSGKSWLGQEFHLRADYTLWTGFKVQAMAGWLFPSNGDIAGKYILQLLYNF
jgi:hypothetical protein